VKLIGTGNAFVDARERRDYMQLLYITSGVWCWRTEFASRIPRNVDQSFIP